MPGHPTDIFGTYFMLQQPWMVVARYHIQRIVLQVFARDIPGVSDAVIILTTFNPADTQPFTLTQRIEGKPVMLAYLLAVVSKNRTRIGRQITIKKLPKGALADKADTGGIFFCRIRQTQLMGNLTHLGFVNFTQWEQG